MKTVKMMTSPISARGRRTLDQIAKVVQSTCRLWHDLYGQRNTWSTRPSTLLPILPRRT
jgi:hypothetical protein